MVAPVTPTMRFSPVVAEAGMLKVAEPRPVEPSSALWCEIVRL